MLKKVITQGYSVMYKKLILLVISISFYGCCTNHNTLVSGKEFFAVSSKDSFTKVESINKNSAFIARFSYSTYTSRFELIKSAYATSCGIVATNKLLLNSFELYFDKPISIGGVGIPANTNLVSLKKEMGFDIIVEHIFPDDTRQYLVIYFNDAFYQKSPTFLSEPYQVSYKIRTDDDVQLSGSVTVAIAI